MPGAFGLQPACYTEWVAVELRRLGQTDRQAEKRANRETRTCVRPGDSSFVICGASGLSSAHDYPLHWRGLAFREDCGQDCPT